MTVSSTLSKRGTELSHAPAADIKSLFDKQRKDAYDPEKNPNGFINMGTAENYSLIPDVAEYINNSNVKFPEVAFSYGEGYWGTDRMRKAMAKFIDKHFKPLHKTDPEDLLFSSGVSSICEMLGFALFDKGDGLLLSTPCYQGFLWDFTARAHVEMVFTNFEGVDQFSLDGVAKYEQALLAAEAKGTKIRALMLCNPHNPLAQCYPKESVIALMKLCQKYQVHLLCDEIYATSVYDVGDPKAVKFTSALSFDHTPYIDTNYLHVMYGMSKDMASGGTRLGCIYVRNQQLQKAIRAQGMFHWPSAFSQQVAVTMLEDEEWCDKFLERAREKLATRNKLTRKMLDDAGVSYHGGANAGFFLWIDLRPWLPNGRHSWEQEEALSKRLLDDKKLFLTPGKMLAAESPGFFRVIFSQDETTLKTGLGRLFSVLEALSQAA